MKPAFYKENSYMHHNGDIHVMVYESDSTVPYHCHDEEEFICITDGVCICKVDSSTYIVKKGEYILIRSEHLHAVLQYKSENFHYFSVVFHPLYLFGNDLGKYFMERYRLKAVYRNDIEHEKQITEHLDEIYTIFKAKPFAYEIKLKLHLLSIYDCIFSSDFYTVRSAANVNTKKSALIEKAFNYIHINYMYNIDINDIARNLNYSASYVTKLFREYSGQTPVKYLIDYRIYKAKELLENTQMTVLDIAMSVGFNHIGHFIKTFKKYTNTTPLRYRKTGTNTRT